MSNISFMDKLQHGVEVEWQPLEQVAKIKHGKDWKGLDEGDIPVYGSGGIMRYVDKYSYDKPTVLIPRKGTITNIFYVDSPFWNIDTVYYTEIDTSKISPKYLFHFIKTIDLMALDTGSGRPSLTQAILNKIEVPIPCPENPKKSREIQTEIVRMLDSFTDLTSELTTELNARKKQYSYYREKLLTEVYGTAREFTIGEVLDMRAGKNIKSKDISETETSEHKYMCNGGNGSRGFVKNFSHDGNYVLIGRQGALCGNVKREKGKFYATEHAVVCSPKDGVNIDWIFFMLTFMNLNQYKSKSAQPGLAVGNIAKLPIIVPPITEQNRVVAILTKFEDLTNSVTKGLPREITLREQQYEYYRDLLLSFPNPDSEVVA